MTGRSAYCLLWIGSGSANGATRVRALVDRRATDLGVPVSVPVVCDVAAARLGGGVTQTVEMSTGWPETRYATDALGVRLAELQVTVGEGPALDVWRDGGPVLVPDLSAPIVARRWPLFAPLAVQSGAGALFALPLAVGTIRVGVLAVHLSRPRHLDAGTQSDLLAFADLALRLHMDDDHGPGPLLRGPQVHQATGMIAAQLDVSIDEAFNRLRARAFADERPLAELATDVVAGRVRFDPRDDAS